MGYLLKEALKTLCGVNQWSYAIFWKIGCQNPKLLIWEECYYEPIIYANIAHGVQVGNKVHSLVTKMMTENYVNLLGEGLVGRAAFTGSHQWILSDDKPLDAYPPEVSNEVHMQISAGMQTIAVIPVHTHGVVQLGSSLTIMENMRFVNDVKSLIFQLGCVPGALLSETYMNNESTSDAGPNCGTPIGLGNNVSSHSSGRSKVTASTLFTPDSYNQQGHSPKASGNTGHTSLGTHTANYRNSGGSKLSSSISSRSSVKSHDNHCQAENMPSMKQNVVLRGKQQIAVMGEAISQNQGVWMGQGADMYIQDPQTAFSSIAGNHDPVKSTEQKILSESFVRNYVSDSVSTGSGSKISQIIGESSKAVCDQLSGSSNKHSLSETRISRAHVDRKCMQPKLTSGQEKLNHELFQALTMSSEEACHKPSSGDDLFDVVGVNFRNKLFDGSWNNLVNNGIETNSQNLNKNNSVIMDHQGAGSDLFSVTGGESDSGIFSSTANDHLLDAVVSKVHSCSKQVSDDNVSCSTSLTKNSGSSAPIIASSSGGANGFINLVQGELITVPKSLRKTAVLSSCSYKSGISKEDGGNFSETSSIYSSQIRSWIEQGNDMRKNSGVSSECSKKTDENSKSNRKRLKPGENPRPRPKDRQMIQDRVKELREIVPNGAKCSIDALLERTIKHMLFLQSVTKHADKLKQNGESKIVNKDGGLLLRDNFEGGATWAYEVGSQSMVCPIIVEDLNSPRQMLVEMLCEERGLFLEIADIIRGLGLTILKGVMESRNDKIWARFTVEANRDVTRMEIFLSLVRLLEQPVKNSAALAEPSDNVNAAVQQHSFHQVASIPAGGRPCGLH